MRITTLTIMTIAFMSFFSVYAENSDQTIYFLSDESGAQNIWRAEYLGTSISNKQQLTDFEYDFVIDFDIHESRGEIAFIVRDGDENSRRGDLYIMDLNGNNKYLVPNQPDERAGQVVNWSPDGSTIVFTLGAERYHHNLVVATINPDGSNYQRIIETNEPRGYATHKNTIEWTENGMYIGDTRQWSAHATRHEIFLRDNNGDFTNLTNTGSVGERYAYLSPDKQTLVFQTLTNLGDRGISIMPEEGGSQTVVIERKTDYNTWPNGWLSNDRILYTFCESSEKCDIYAINIDGSDVVNITNDTDIDYSSALLIGKENDWSVEDKLVIESVDIYSLDNNLNRIPLTNATDSRIEAQVRNNSDEIFTGDLFFRVDFIDIPGVGNDLTQTESIIEVLTFSARNVLEVLNYDLQAQIFPNSSVNLRMYLPNQIGKVHTPMMLLHGVYADKMIVHLYEETDDRLIYHDSYQYDHTQGFEVLPHENPLYNYNSLLAFSAQFFDSFNHIQSAKNDFMGKLNVLRDIWTYGRKWQIAKAEGRHDEARSYYRSIFGIAAWELFKEGLDMGGINELALNHYLRHIESLHNLQISNPGVTYYEYWDIDVGEFFGKLIFKDYPRILLGNNLLFITKEPTDNYYKKMNYSSVSYNNIKILTDNNLQHSEFVFEGEEGYTYHIYLSNTREDGTVNIVEFDGILQSKGTSNKIVVSDTTSVYSIEVDESGDGIADKYVEAISVENHNYLAPNPVQNMLAEYDGTYVILEWDHGDSNANYQYVIYRDTIPEYPISMENSVAIVNNNIYIDNNYSNDQYNYYWVTVLDENMNESIKTEPVIVGTGIVNVKKNHLHNLTFNLFPNYPNPFNPSTKIRYSLHERKHLTLSVYNTLGQEVTKLVDQEKEPGTHEITFDASHLPSGVYIYRLQAGEYVESRKMLYLK